MNNEPIICKKCAHRQYSGTHCDFCGNLLIERRKPETKMTKFAWLRILGFAAILGLGFVYFTFFRSAPPPTPIDPEPTVLFPAQQSGVLNKVMKTATQADDSDKPTGEKVFAKAAPNIVTLYQDDAAGKHLRVIGAGFLLDDTTIATNYHVVHGNSAVSAQFNDDSYTKVTRFLQSDQKHDVALLQIDKVEVAAKDAAIDSLEAAGKQVSAAGMNSADPVATKTEMAGLRAGRSAALNVGETVIAAGTPKGLSGSLAQGIVTAMPGGMLKTNLPVKSDWSGGPLLNMQGEVVGMLTSQAPDNSSGNFALPIDWVTDLQPGVTGPAAGTSTTSSTTSAPSHTFGPYSFRLTAHRNRTVAFTTPSDLENAQFSARMTAPAGVHLHLTILHQGHVMYDSGDTAGARFTLTLKRGDYVMLIENSGATTPSDVTITGTFSNDI